MDSLLIRCSALGLVHTDAKTKAKKDAGELSETVKTYLRELYLEREFGFKDEVFTDEMKKGIMLENDSICLCNIVLGGKTRAKNEQYFKNEYICGTPDVILNDYVEDVKTSSNLKTFINAELNKNYYWQLQGYMELTGLSKARLIYCLHPDPFEIVQNKKKVLYYKFDCDENNQSYIDACNQIDHNNSLIEFLPNEKRIKVFEFEKVNMDQTYEKIEKIREYYKTISI